MAENAICMKYGPLEAKEMRRGQITVISCIMHYQNYNLECLLHRLLHFEKRTLMTFRRFTHMLGGIY